MGRKVRSGIGAKIYTGAALIVAGLIFYFIWIFIPSTSDVTLDRSKYTSDFIQSDEDCRFLAAVLRSQYQGSISLKLPVLDDTGEGYIKCDWRRYGLDLRNASRKELQSSPPLMWFGGDGLVRHIYLGRPRYSLLHNRAAIYKRWPSEVGFCYFDRTLTGWKPRYCRVKGEI